MMGAGKTTIGKVLSKKLDKLFIDTDHEIVRRTGVAIPTIFDIEGEDGFRTREHTVLEELVLMNNVVLATGGGIVLQEANRQLLKSHGVVVYLRAGVQDIWERTRHDRSRPLLQTDNPQEVIKTLYEKRDPLYSECAHISIDTSNQSIHHLVNSIVHKINNFSRKPL